MTTSPSAGDAVTDSAAGHAVEIVRELDARMNDHDLEGALELWAPQATLVWPVGAWEGKPAIREAFSELLTALPDYHQETDLLISDDRHVASEVRAMGTFTGGPLGGFQPTGADSSVHMAKFYTVDDGLVVRGRVFWDHMEFAREMGLMPEQHSVGDRAMTQVLNAVTKVRNVLEQARRR